MEILEPAKPSRPNARYDTTPPPLGKIILYHFGGVFQVEFCYRVVNLGTLVVSCARYHWAKWVIRESAIRLGELWIWPAERPEPMEWKCPLGKDAMRIKMRI